MKSTEELINAWSDVTPAGLPPHVLPGDEGILERDYSCASSIHQYEAEIEEDRISPKRLQLGLAPVPYSGNLRSARVFILMLNPGFIPLDIHAEQVDSHFRSGCWNSLHQRFAPDECPNPFFDPKNIWTGGASYWIRKLDGVIKEVMENRGLGYADTLREFSRSMAFIEFFPYHSRSFGVSETVLRELRSTQLITRFVETFVERKVDSGEAGVIVARQSKRWNIKPGPNAVVFTGQQARGAHMTSGTEAGNLIVRMLCGSNR